MYVSNLISPCMRDPKSHNIGTFVFGAQDVGYTHKGQGFMANSMCMLGSAVRSLTNKTWAPS